MLIHLAETGRTIELVEKYHSGTRVEEVQAFLRDLTGISRESQLLWVGNSRLEAERTLGAYGLPSEQLPIFLFTRQMLVQGSPPPKPEVLDGNLDVRFPESLPPLRSSMFGSSPDPAIRALFSYEQQLKHHLQKGHAIFSASEAKLEASRQLVMEVSVQTMALDAVLDSMEQLHGKLEAHYAGFMTDFQRQSQQRAEILTNFEADVQKLQACTLHPQLQIDNLQTLGDCIDEAFLRTRIEDCASVHTRLCHEVAQRNKVYQELKREAQGFLQDAVGMNFDRELEVAHRCIEEQDDYLQSISKNASMVTQRIEGSPQSRHTVQDLLSAIAPIYDNQQRSHLPRMEDLDRDLGKILEFCLKGKNAMSLRVHSKMQIVARLQKGIRDTKESLSAFRGTMESLDKDFEALKLPRRTGNSYKACLAEVVRRKADMKLYVGLAGQLVEKLARRRDQEVGRREAFLRLHSANLPGRILAGMGLSGLPSQFTIEIPEFDTKLLDVDVHHIEQYAPKYLLGSMVTSGDGWNSEVDEYGIDEIAGTSKMEVENVRLKAQLASSIAIICSLDSQFQPEYLGDPEDQESKLQNGSSVVGKTLEALRLKDEHARNLENLLTAKQTQCTAYEDRIGKLEEMLRQQEEHKYSSLSTIDTMMTNEDLVNVGQLEEVSGVTTEGTADPMDGVSSSAPPDVDKPEAEDDATDESKSCSVELQKDKLSLKDDQIKCLLVEVFRLAEELRLCQLNFANLEKRLHEAHKCNASAAIKRLELDMVSCTGGFGGLLKCLRDSPKKLSSTPEGQVLAELCNTFSERVEGLTRELAEATERQMRKELESKGEVIKNLFTKCKLEKQTSREKVCMQRFEVHELALFLRNSAGHYEALNRNSPNYYLSDGSIALFGEHQEQQQVYILGQIVHIEHHIARDKSASDEDGGDLRSSFAITTGRPRHNPYGLPAGTHFFVVTVAMVPGFH